MVTPVPQEGTYLDFHSDSCTQCPHRTSHPRGRHQVSLFTLHLLFFSSNFPISIRNRLTALKKNRGEYIKASDVNTLYQAVVKQGMSRNIPNGAFLISPLSHQA